MNSKKQTKTKGAIIIEGHVQGLSNTRALGELHIPIYVIDTCHCIAQHSKYCKKFFKCPDFSSPQFIEFLIELQKKEELKDWVLIPSNDHIVENLSKNKELISKYFKTIVPDISILNNIINKRKLLEIAVTCNTPIPKTCYPQSKHLVSEFHFPILIKGNKGLSFYKALHTKAIQINSLKDVNKTLSHVLEYVDENNIMIQELIPYNPKYKVISFTCFAINGIIKTHWSGEKLHEHPIKYGTATLSNSIENKEILAYSIPLIKKLLFTGVCEIEYLFDERDNQYKLIEINPRTWLWVELAKQCGINYSVMIYNYLNNTPNVYPQSYKLNIKWINRMIDTIYGIQSILAHKYKLKDFINQRKGEKVYAINNSSDLMPGIIFPFILIYIYFHRK